MLDSLQKRKIRSILYNKVTLVVLFVLVLIILRGTWVVFQKERESASMKNISIQHTEDLRSRNADLKSKTERLNTEVGVEEEIRSKFSVVKGGENMVLVVDNPDSIQSTTTPETSFWQKFIDFFTKK